MSARKAALVPAALAQIVRSFNDLTPEEQTSYREWKYGPRGGQGHKVQPASKRDPYSCVARHPETGLYCGRTVNWVGEEHYAPRGTGKGHWRHGPRPYGRSMKYRRRSMGPRR